MDGISNIFSAVCVAIGAVIMLRSILGTRHVLQLLQGEKRAPYWKALLYLMIFFLLGYLGVLILIASGMSEWLLVLTGLVFFFGALFVYLVVWIGQQTIADLKQEITERKKVEMQLQEHRSNLEQQNEMLIVAKQKAEEASVAKSEFLANMSHELRTPLTGIIGFANRGIANIEVSDKNKFNKYFRRVRENGERLLELLNDILDLSKLQSGKTNYQMSLCNLMEPVELVIRELEGLAKEQSIHLKVIPSSHDLSAHFDKNKINQVLRNIIHNAIKFTPSDGKITISFAPSTLPKGKRKEDKQTLPAVTVTIHNEGENIPEQELESIFDKFTQSSATKTTAGGTGLGLSICQEIILEHRGQIWAENSTAGGPQFHFTLPQTHLDGRLSLSF